MPLLAAPRLAKRSLEVLTMESKNVLVLGAGVSGLTTALALLRAGHKVTIWSKEAPGEFAHTSMSAYAMWVPVTIGADHRIERWAMESLAQLRQLAEQEDTGVTRRNIYVLKMEYSEPWYAGKVGSFRHARREEFSTQYQDANVLEAAPIIDPAQYLPWLYKQVIAGGAVCQQHTVENIGDCPPQYQVVVNCCGLGARRLANDSGLVPERVQVVTVKPNGFDKVVIDDEGPNKRACIVPHRDYIKIGAVFDGPIETLEVDDASTVDILERCMHMAPGFKVELADVISVTRALRPERAMPRVERESRDGRLLIHNYGHDGMGFILSHGIADEIVRMIG